MKTLSTLPTLPDGWAWVRDRHLRWRAVSHATAEDITLTAAFLRDPPPTFGTPPVGSTVWDPQSLDWARYQPEGA